ncbi:MAG: hypothetical protein AAF488_12310, partial [Planctomycetota bacterium]
SASLKLSRSPMPRSLILAALLGVTLLAPTPADAQGIGPDVIVSEIGTITRYGTLLGMTSYSFSTTSCNIGDVEAQWIDTTNQHPVIASNMFRLRNGRFEQIAIGWLKHGFCALSQPDCGTCNPTPCSTLGVGCADTYGSTLNGDQTGLGPRYEINASTGEFPYPFDTIGLSGPVLYKRLQVAQSDLSPALNPGSTFYYECQYIHPEEPAFGTQYNNVSYRRFSVGLLQPEGYAIAPVGDTIQQAPAIAAWQAADPEVALDDILIDDDGMLILGSRATDLGGGQWHYEYALYNMNSHRSAGSFSVSLPAGATVSNVGFHDINYHSGEPFSPVDWTATVSGSEVRWETESFATNENANALRWGTLYNFRFDCDVEPDLSNVNVGLFRPGTAADPSLTVVGPGQAPCSTPDFVRGDANGDFTLDISDVVYSLAFQFQAGPPMVPTEESGDANADLVIDISDPVYVLAFLFTGGSPPPFPFPNPGCL